jgi:hypothetical protein
MNPFSESREGRLFQSLDIEKEGISVYQEKNILMRAFDFMRGRMVEVTIAGQTVRLDKGSLDKFLKRNKSLLKKFEDQQMSITEQLLYLHRLSQRKNKGLPRGLIDADAIGGEEAREDMIGDQEEFELAGQKAIEYSKKKGIELDVKSLLDSVKKKEKGLVRLNRELMLRKLTEENKHLSSKLKEVFGKEVKDPVRKYIENILKSISLSRD